MTKRSNANQLPRVMQRHLEEMGEHIRLARKRRALSIAALAERAQCSELTIIRIERGTPTVSIGIYARVLFALGLGDDILLIAKDDIPGNTLVNARLLRSPKQEKDSFDVFD